MPTIKTVYADLERAEVPKRDKDGKVVDLHALRTTLSTDLARQGIGPQIAQRLMRHSDYRLTLRRHTPWT